ncbi:uncharacterized protein V6R79_004379 [Siganus canaliculatus]
MEYSETLEEKIRAIIQAFFQVVPHDQLTSSRQTEAVTLVIQEMLAAIVETTELHFQHVVLSTTSEPVPSTSMVTMDKVYEYIGSTVSDAFANVNDDPDCPSTEKITEVVAEEVTDRVNVLLSKESSNTNRNGEAFPDHVATISIEAMA